MQRNAKLAEELRDKLVTRTTSEGMKEMLELEYRVGVLELENMELEHSRMLHDLIVRQKDMKLRKHKLRVRATRRFLVAGVNPVLRVSCCSYRYCAACC